MKNKNIIPIPKSARKLYLINFSVPIILQQNFEIMTLIPRQIIEMKAVKSINKISPILSYGSLNLNNDTIEIPAIRKRHPTI
jgi:hypothetical protein